MAATPGAYALALIALAPLAAKCTPHASQADVATMCDYAPVGKPKGKPRLDPEQLANATAVIRVAANKNLPRRAAVIGIATTLQESDLHNGVVGDNGTAFGIFQQRPVSGWGTIGTATNPETAAGKFYSRLTKVSGWKYKPLTVVAQSVQRSAFPDAYAKHESRADQIVSHVAWKACK